MQEMIAERARVCCSQGGNNNAYCQDNKVSRYDWRLIEQNREILRFAREVIALRRRNPVLRTDAFYTGEELGWFGPEGQSAGWEGPTRVLGCLVQEQGSAGALCLLFNASETPVEFHLPPDAQTLLANLHTP
jgi:glycogen operon protein